MSNLFEYAGSGPYVVIDNRNKKPSKSQDDQSDEGNDCLVKFLISQTHVSCFMFLLDLWYI